MTEQCSCRGAGGWTVIGLCRQPNRCDTLWRFLFAVIVTLSVGCLGASPVVPTVAASEAPAVPPEVSSRVVMITAAADSPQTILVWAGDRVLFVNNDRVQHEIPSDQRPSHLECLGINQAWYIAQDLNREIENFIALKTCTYHGHLDALTPGLLETTVVVERP